MAQKFCDKCPEDIERTDDEQILDRVLIISQPKAGTYLLAEILQNCEFENTNLHLGLDRLQAYEPKARDAGLQDPRQFDVFCPIEESRNLIRFGQVAVSHFQYSKELAASLSAFKIIHSKRELRSAFRSLARMYLHSDKRGRKFKAAIEQDGISGLMRLRGEEVISEALKINRWAGACNVLSLKMENVLSEPEVVISDLLSHLGIKSSRSAADIWRHSRAAETLTKSSSYPDLIWTGADEKVFSSLGGIEANERLGYVELP